MFALAALDLGNLVLKWAHGQIAFSVLWVAAILGGILLWKGRRSAAGFMAYLAAFATGSILGVFGALPFIFPPRFLSIALSVAPRIWRWEIGYWCAVALLALAILRVTTSAAARQSLRGTMFAVPSRWFGPGAFIGYGLVLTACLVGAIGLFIRSVQPETAIAAARRQTGNGYEYFVTNFHVSWQNGRSTGDATVIAYNEHEIREIPVRWEDQPAPDPKN